MKTELALDKILESIQESQETTNTILDELKEKLTELEEVQDKIEMIKEQIVLLEKAHSEFSAITKNLSNVNLNEIFN